MQHNLLGDFRTSLTFLNRVQSKDTRTDTCEIIARLGVNDLDAAKQRARAILQRDGYTPSNDRIFGIVLDSSAIAPLPEDSMLSIVRHGIDIRVSDYLLMAAVGQCFGASDDLKNDVGDLIAPAESEYPLTRAFLNVFDNPAYAVDLLNNATPGSEIEEVMRLVLKLLASSLDEPSLYREDEDALSVWIEEDLPVLKDLLAEVPRAEDKLIVITWLGLVNWAVKQVSEEQHTQALDSLLEQLKTEARGDPRSEMVIKASEKRISWLES